MRTSQIRSRHAATGGRRRAGLLTTAVLVVGLGLAGCASDHGRPTGSATPTGGDTSTSVPSPPADQTGPSGRDVCEDERGWGTGAREGSTTMSPAPVYLVRVGRHDCYDRVVFDLNGDDVVGYVVRYVPVVAADPSGQPVPVDGGATLQVVIRAPILGTDAQGHQPGRTPPAVGADMVAPAAISGWAAVTAVKFAGSFEGQTTFAVGVTERRPFRVLVTSEQHYRHVVVDLAH